MRNTKQGPRLTLFRKSSPLWTLAIDLRIRVFVEEQKVPLELEIDADDEIADHLLIQDQHGSAQGTLRIVVRGTAAKIGRVAVTAACRRQGIGTLLMENAISHCRSLHLRTVELDSQTYITGFYRRLGFMSQGEEFMDAGLPHIRMVLPINS